MKKPLPQRTSASPLVGVNVAEQEDIRRFARSLLSATQKMWGPQPEDIPRIREGQIDYLLRQEEFHLTNLRRVRGMLKYYQEQED